jgi:hypothetical protein
MPTLPRELIIQIAEANLSAAVDLMTAEVITHGEFAMICNGHERTDFEEHWSFLGKISRLKDERAWVKSGRASGLKHMEFAWLVLHKEACWSCQHWASKARYQLALRGILSCARDRDVMSRKAIYENLEFDKHIEYVCDEFNCYKLSVLAAYISDRK